MDLYVIFFYFFALLTVISAFVVVFARNIVHAAFALMFTFFGVAALYVLLYADFVAVTQLLVYVGGILVLIIFGVMLTTRIFSVDMKTGTLNVLPATVITAFIAGMLIFVFYVTDWNIVPDQEFDTTVYGIGTLLVNDFILPMQVAGVLLLVAMIGAVMMAARDRSRSQSK
jgi:NADH-quinone oxidoreductase subunit J